jgi:neutral ceramidase
MTIRIFGRALALAIAVVAIAPPALAQERGRDGPVPEGARIFRAGAATSNITPALGAVVVGGFVRPQSTHINDDLHVRCLALDDGTTQLVFAVVDNVGVPREVFDEAKRQIHLATKVPPENLMMSATHTHSGPGARGPEPRVSASQTLDDYQNFLIRRIVDGVQRALNNLAPARLGFGTGQVPQHVFNRRWLLKDGETAPNPFGGQDRAVMNPGGYQGRLLKPAGPVNPEVYFLSLESVEGRPLALLANYWLHYVSINAPQSHISAGYFGSFCERVEQLLDAGWQSPAFVGLLANGPCGDVTNTNYAAPAARKKYAPYEKVREVANDVAQEVVRVRRTIQHHDAVQLRAAQAELELKMRRPSPEEVRRARDIIARPAGVSPIHRREVAYAGRTLAAIDSPEQVSILVQVFRVGDVAIVALPFEVFTETGLEIKAKSPFQDTFTIELANGSYGYLPTPEQHELGGYETWLGTNRVEKEASPKIVAKVLELFERLK